MNPRFEEVFQRTSLARFVPAAHYTRLRALFAEVHFDFGELIVRQGEELKAQFAALDRTSVEAIEQYRANALARDKAIDAFEARTSEFNARLTALGEDRAGFTQRCDNRRFDELDEAAIRNGK